MQKSLRDLGHRSAVTFSKCSPHYPTFQKTLSMYSSLQGEYLNLQPLIFLKLSETFGCLKRYPSPKHTARMHFYTLKTASKVEQKMWKRKIANILETARNPQISASGAMWRCSTRNDYWFQITSKRNSFCVKLHAIFMAVKMNFGSKFGAWVSFHAAILQSWKFQENLGRRVAVLPLLV